jgi:hypothetical protein
MRRGVAPSVLVLTLLAVAPAAADVGDPQVRTDHPWYPGELACSTFERLFATQAELYRRVTGIDPQTEEQKALAAWFWRNVNFWHGEDGQQDLWGKGFAQSEKTNREYWAGLFGYGFALCGSSHAQWSAEMERLLGHASGRCVGVDGHNSFEVLLTGGPYAGGKWVLLDHDISTVIFNRQGTALLSIPEVKADLKQLTDRRFSPQRQRGWLVSGLHPTDAPGVYTQYNMAEYLPGYAAAPPMVHLRRGETLRRYLDPGLEDGRTFVFWGRNYRRGGIPGPERDLTWVNQPERMHGSRDGTPPRVGQARFANAVYTYKPDFGTGGYREGVTEESDHHLVFAFYTPYMIAATPPNDEPWGVYKPGCKNGLVLRGQADCPVAVSVDRGRSWKDCGRFHDGMDLTDHVKGYRHYLLRLSAGAKALAGVGLTMRTVCQANPCIMPRLQDGGSRVQFAASGQAVISVGPTLAQAQTHVVAGGFQTPEVTLELATPHAEPVLAIHAAAQIASGNPPQPDVKYAIEYSVNGGGTWKPIVRDWTIPRRGDEPKDFWSQSFCYGSVPLADPVASPVRVRFRNTGNKNYLRAEVHLVYRTGKDDTRVTFAWTDEAGAHEQSHVFGSRQTGPWQIATGRQVRTRWVEFEPAGEK